MIIIPIHNNKGGVAKTTVTVNLGASLTKQDKSVLILDNDPQGDTTRATALKEHTEYIEEYYQKELDGMDYSIQPVKSNRFGYDILPCSSKLTDIASALSSIRAGRFEILKRILSRLENSYDYVLIDNMPTMSPLVINSFVAADYVIIPTRADYLSASHIKDELWYLRSTKKRFNPKLEIMGISIQMVNWRTLLCRGIVSSVRDSYPDISIFHTMIPDSVRVQEASFLKTPLYAHKKAGKIADAYDQFAKEVIEHGK